MAIPRKVVDGVEYVQIGADTSDQQAASFDLDGRHYPPGSWLRIVPGGYSTALTNEEFAAIVERSEESASGRLQPANPRFQGAWLKWL